MPVNLGARNLGVIVTASLAGLLFGFDTVVISGVTRIAAPGLSPRAGQLLVWLLGRERAARHVSSARCSPGSPGDRYGSRDTLKAVGFMYVVSALGCAFCWNLESFYVFRFIGGLAIGASSVLAPVYISEIAPADRRGTLTGLVPVQHRVRHPARVRQQLRSCSSWPAASTRGA